ncbi:hypothetical protein [Roseibium algae]|uniref:Uncharacterized protein n=1 Tax=Roseibium algae TaxID=3123038 RepID=A0ABU8TGI8_9HYPH
MTNFQNILTLFGLSNEEAASYLNVETPDVVRWCTTDDSPPIEVWKALVMLFDSIRFAAEDAAKTADLDHLQATDLNSISFALPAGFSANNAHAQLKGPERAATAMAVASLARVFV